MFGRFRLLAIVLTSIFFTSCYDYSHKIKELIEYVPVDSSKVSFEWIYNGEFYTHDKLLFNVSLTEYKYKGNTWPNDVLRDSAIVNQSAWLFKRRGIGFGARIEEMKNSLGEKGGVVYYKLRSENAQERRDGLPGDNGVAVIYCINTKKIYLASWRVHKAE